MYVLDDGIEVALSGRKVMKPSFMYLALKALELALMRP